MEQITEVQTRLTPEQKMIITKSIYNAINKEMLDTNQIDLDLYYKVSQGIEKMKA